MTTAQVAKAAKISWNTAREYLNMLHKKGWIEKEGETTIYWIASYG